MTEDKMVTVPRADIEFVVQIANRNEWSREGDRLAALLSAPHKDIGGEVEAVAWGYVADGNTYCISVQETTNCPQPLMLISDHAAIVERLTRGLYVESQIATECKAALDKAKAALTASEARVAELEAALRPVSDVAAVEAAARRISLIFYGSDVLPADMTLPYAEGSRIGKCMAAARAALASGEK